MAKQEPPQARQPDDDDKTPILTPKAPEPWVYAAAPAPGSAAAKRSVEDWAQQKGMLPMEMKAHGVFGALAINPQYWKFAGAQALRSWRDGEQTTEAEFDAAVAELLGASFR